MCKRPSNRALLERILEQQETIIATLADLATAEGALTTDVASLVTSTQAIIKALADALAAGATVPQNLIDAINTADTTIKAEVSAETAAMAPPTGA